MRGLAVEIWHSILLYTIDVPFLLDTLLDTNRSYWDDADRYHQTDVYEQSELQRKTLRLVCRSWCAFVDEYRHRWITYSTDPNAKSTDHSNALKAINSELPSYPRRIMFRIASEQDFDTFQYMIDTRSNKARILFTECMDEQEDVVFNYIMQNHAKLPNLRNLGVGFPKRSMPLRAISSSFPRLTTLGINDKPTVYVCTEDDQLDLPELEMLKLDLSAFQTSSLKSWKLPSLIHLITPVHPHRIGGVERGLEPIQIFGANLVFLYIYRLDVPITLPGEFWNWCPVLKEFSALLSYVYFQTRAPAHHPLNYLFHWPHYDSRDQISIPGTENVQKPLVLHNLQMLPPGFKRFTVWNSWDNYLIMLKARYDRTQREIILLRMHEICVERQIHVEDQERVLLADFLVASKFWSLSG